MNDVLIVWGGLELHQPRECSEIVAKMLREDGLSVDITADYGAFAEPAIRERKLVIPNITGDTLDRASEKNLISAVRGGVGLGGHHGALATSFRDAWDFHYMTGVQWVQHPGDIRDYRVDIVRGDDPVMAGIESFDYHSEQYYLLYDQTVDILATTTFDGAPDPMVRGVTVPVVLKRQFGRGRIFYSSLGHQAHEFGHTPMRTILRRGLGWAARG